MAKTKDKRGTKKKSRGDPPPPRNNWSVDQRTTLHLLNTRSNADHPDIAHIFNHIFAAQLQARGFPATGMKAQVIREDYQHRDKAARSKAYHQIDTATPSQGQRAREARLVIDINNAIAALGLVGIHMTAAAPATAAPQPAAQGQNDYDDDSKDKDDDYPSDPDEQDIDDVVGQQIDDLIASRAADSTGQDDSYFPYKAPTTSRKRRATFKNNRNNTTDNEMVRCAEGDIPMIHYTDFININQQIAPDPSLYINPSTDLYKKKGWVYRTNAANGFRLDIMICQRTECDRCRDNFSTHPPTDPNLEHDLEEVKNKPVVHHGDCEQMWKDAYFLYVPSRPLAYHSPYPPLWRTRVEFHFGDGSVKKMEAAMCRSDYCKDCKVPY